jgi:hypothetical protein
MNKERNQSVEISFGGKVRHIVYDYNALAELEDIAATFHSASPKRKILRAMLWAGLLAETLDSRGRETADTLSLFQVGEILGGMSDAEMSELERSISEAKGLSAVPDDAERPTEPPPANL